MYMRKHAPPCGVYMRKHAPPRLAGRGTPRRKVQASDTSDVPLIACRCVWVWGVTERERGRVREREEERERERKCDRRLRSTHLSRSTVNLLSKQGP